MTFRISPWRGAGGGWEVDIRIKGPNGERIRERIKSPAASPSGTKRWAAARELELIKRQLVPRHAPTPSAPTLAEFSPRWIREYAVAQRQKPSTIEAKRSILETHLIPLLGAVPLDRIGAAEAAKIKTLLSGRSPKTVNNALSVLHRLTTAGQWAAPSATPMTRTQNLRSGARSQADPCHGPGDRKQTQPRQRLERGGAEVPSSMVAKGA